MQSPLQRLTKRHSYNATTGTTTRVDTFADGAMAQASHAAPRPEEPADPTSIIVVDAAPTEKTLADFFTFDSPGGFTWWAGAILGLLGCCAFASMVIIQVETNRREPPAVMALMSAQQCPLLSSALPPLAFAAWRSTCASVKKGSAHTCATSADCVALGGLCADPNLLARLQCVSTTGEGSVKQGKVCAYPSANSTATSTTAPSPGFCTNAGTTCALCFGSACGATTPSAGSIGCPSTSACSGNSWLCNPLAL